MPHTAALDATARLPPSRAEPLTLDGVAVTVPEPGGGELRILDIPALRIPPGQSVGIAGPSGAGKTTLLHLIAGLLLPSTGSVQWGTETVNVRSEAARDRWRRRMAGLVFQDFALVPELSVLDNIVLPASFHNWRVPPAARSEAAALAGRMGLAKLSARVASLSRGEQQRVAVARALFGKPALLLADEPTASLDIENGAIVAAMLLDGARANGATLVAVSHDAALLTGLDRVIRLASGRIVEDSAP
jgi:putative ABC transport system ATP-binding protein